MPGNLVIINNSKELEWYVGDSKMDSVISFLDEVGIREQKPKKTDENRLESE